MKKYFSLISALTLALAVHALDFTYQGITYNTLSDSTVQTYSDFTSAPIQYSGEITIPDVVYDEGNNSYTVVGIGESSFMSSDSLTRVVLPNTIRSIGDYAFANCRMLTDIEINDGVTYIGQGAFARCISLQQLVIPQTILSLGSDFIGGSLEDIVTPGNILKSQLRRLTIEAATPPSAAGAFNSIVNDSVTLFVPDTVLTTYQNNTEYSSYFSAICGYSIGKVNILATSSSNTVQFTWFGDRMSVRYELYLRKGTEVVAIYDVDAKGNAVKRSARPLLSQAATLARAPKLTNDTTTSSTEMFVISLGGMETNVDYNYEIVGFNNANHQSLSTTGSFKLTDSGIQNVQAEVIQAIYYTLSVITADPTMGKTKGSGTYKKDADVSIEAIANTGYHFTQWSDGVTLNPRVVKVSDDMSITAFFAIDQHTVTLVSADLSMGTVTGGGTFDYGTEITIIAKPKTGYRFIRWNDGDTQAERKVVVKADISYSAEFDHIYYTINAKSADEKMGSVTGGGVYQYAHKVHLNAIPEKGYEFVRWDDGNTDNPRYLSAMEDVTYIAEFRILRHTVSVKSSSEQMGTVEGGGTFDYGTVITITAKPKEGYEFLQWDDANTESTRQLTVVKDVTYTAQFALKQIPKHTITAQASDAAMGSVTGGGIYPEGNTHLLTAIANEGYRFVRWSDGVTDNPRTITVTADATYTAVFEILRFTISVTSADSDKGNVEGGGTFDYGTEITLTATAIKGYRFVRWNDGTTDNPRTVVVRQDSAFTAEFEIARYKVTAVSSDATMGAVTGGGTFDYGTEITLIATPLRGHVFVQWDDGNTESTRVVTVEADVTYTALFAPRDISQYTISVTSADPTMGTATGGGVFNEGDTRLIEAVANEGYRFARWNDGVTVNPRTIVVTADATYTAFFVPIDDSVSDISAPTDTAHKVMIDGIIYILHHDRLYDLQGRQVRQ